MFHRCRPDDTDVPSVLSRHMDRRLGGVPLALPLRPQ
jgi:hypothetical protein